MAARFQIRSGRDGRYYFVLLARNGEVTLTSQMYASKAGARKGIAAVQRQASESENFEGRSNKAGQHYFVLKAGNHQVIGSGEAYSGATAMKRGIQSVVRTAPSAEIVDASSS